MAIEEPVDRLTDFVTNYESITGAMLGESSFQKSMLQNIADIFADVGVSTEQMGIALTEMAKETSVQYNKDAVSASLEIIKMAPEFELKSVQRDLVIRQKQGYDDNLKVKILETQGSLASFAVNANSDQAQTTINDLKTQMTQLDARILPLEGASTCPLPTPITPTVTSITTSNLTDTSLTLTITPVLNATLYYVYKDGILYSTQSTLIINDSGLTQNTKYAYNFKASIAGVVSDLSKSFIVKTLITEVTP